MNARPSHVKARQSSKIREIGHALMAQGYLALDEQAKTLGLARSTAWTILRADHKSSGLSATVINRMLAAPHLPPLVRAIILEYVDERLAGLYGHNNLQLRRFTARRSEQRSVDTRTKVAA
jgi:predicted DNA-binding transcriptional regulator AlpA